MQLPSIFHRKPTFRNEFLARHDKYTKQAIVTVEGDEDLAQYDSRSINHWTLEILSATFSLGYLAGLITFLAAVDGKPYNSWHVVGVEITPNTLLSLLSTLCKASFLLCVAESISQLKWLHMQTDARKLSDVQCFDSASRGQLGALNLLWTINRRASLACLGAVVVVLAIAIDPLTNQILTVTTYPTSADNITAFIGAAYAYGAQEMDTVRAVSQPLNDAMVRGLYAPNQQANYTCHSGTCGWGRFQSLAICSTCNDLSDQVTIDCGECSKQDNNVTCQYTTPGGLNDSVTFRSQDGRSVTPSLLLDSEIWDVDSGYTNSSNSSDTISLDIDEHGKFATWSTLRFEQSYSLSNRSFEDYACAARQPNNALPGIRPKSLVCSLSWCINTYFIPRVQAGVLNDGLYAQTPIKIAPEYCTLPPTNGTATQSRSFCPVYPADMPPPPAEQLANSSIPPDPDNYSYVFWINDVVSTHMQAYVQDTFNFGIGSPGGKLGDLGTVSAVQQTFYTANGGNISTTLGDIARSMTNQIRDSPEAISMIGSVDYQVAFIHVRWGWLTYLVILMAMSVVILGSTIVISRRARTPVWKSDILALLLRGRDNGSEQDGSMEMLAKSMRIRLDERERLVTTMKGKEYDQAASL